MTDKPEEANSAATDVETEASNSEYNRKDPKWGTMTKEGLIEFFGIPRETLKYNFRDIITKGKERTKQRLRQAQIKLALSGNATMLIWLGKNMLNQSENPVDTNANAPLPWNEEE